MKQTLAQLHHALATSSELAELLKSVAKEIHNRNVFPINARAYYAGEDLDQLLQRVRSMMEATDMTSRDSIDSDEYRDFRHALWFGEEDGEFNVERSLSMVLAYLMQGHCPSIDDYVQCIDDLELVKRLGLEVDDEGLVRLTDDMELRKHALLLPKRNIMIYPHQFMRRFYGANFVYVPTILEHCRKQGCTVQLRIDPYRQTEPRYYRDIFEADYWYGPEFSEETLKSKDKKPIRTLHLAREDDKLQHITYPLSYTLFRSDMMSENERQFMVEEYIPVTSPLLGSRSVPGIGNKYAIQKFAHFVYDQGTGTFSHIDGAVRTFTVDEYSDVLESVRGSSGPDKRIGRRHKLFKVSGTMDLELVRALLYEFFRYNPHLGEYFGVTTQVEAGV